MMCAVYNNLKNKVQNCGIKLLENFLLVFGPDIKKWNLGEMGRGFVGKGQNGLWAKWESWARWLLSEIKNGRI